MNEHPWNLGSSWRSPEPPFSVLDEGQADRFDRDGFVVLDSVFDMVLVQQLIDEIDRHEAKLDEYLRRQGNAGIAEAGAATFTIHLVTRSELLRSFVTHPRLLGLCADLIGPDVNLYWDQAVYKKTEAPRRFPWHQDNGYTYIEPQQYLTCWIALTDATVENGCPQVVPGVHRLGTLEHHYVKPLGWECFEDPPSDPVAAPVSAGGVVVFSSLTPHLTGPNTTDQVRKAYIVQYAPAGARLQQGDPAAGPPAGEEGCDRPDRQFPVLRSGESVQ